MKKIVTYLCEVFNVVPYEEFDIIDEKGNLYEPTTKFRFSEDALQSYGLSETDKYVWGEDPYTFCNLAQGSYSVKPKLYIPKIGERYSYIEWANQNDLLDDAYVTEDRWTGGLFDHMNLAFGNVFTNAQIAKVHKQDVIERILAATAEAAKQ